MYNFKKFNTIIKQEIFTVIGCSYTFEENFEKKINNYNQKNRRIINI